MILKRKIFSNPKIGGIFKSKDVRNQYHSLAPESRNEYLKGLGLNDNQIANYHRRENGGSKKGDQQRQYNKQKGGKGFKKGGETVSGVDKNGNKINTKPKVDNKPDNNVDQVQDTNTTPVNTTPKTTGTKPKTTTLRGHWNNLSTGGKVAVGAAGLATIAGLGLGAKRLYESRIKKKRARSLYGDEDDY